MKSLFALFTLAALALYTGAYCWMLNGRTIEVDFAKGISGAEQPNYRFGGRATAVIFAPANAMDRSIRHEKWKNEEPLPKHLLDSDLIDDSDN